jgi:PEGA domain-containing protein
MPGGGARGYRPLLMIVAGALGLWLCSAVQAQPPYVAPLPATPGAYVGVPRGKTYVYVPIDAAGLAGTRLAPGVPAPGGPFPPPPPPDPAPRFWFSPATPPPPGSGPPGLPAPVMPRSPAATRLGYLQTEVDPAGASVSIDGRHVGVADLLGGARTLFALEPGMRRIEISRAGFRPLRTEIRVTPGVVFSIRARLDPA